MAGRARGSSAREEDHRRARMRHAVEVEKSLDTLGAEQDRAAKNLVRLANGKCVIKTERFVAAGTVTVEDAVPDEKGKLTKVKRPAYPQLDPEEMVLVERTVVHMAPDRAANETILNRIQGKPVESVELAGPGGGPIETARADDLAGFSTDELQQIEAIYLARERRRAAESVGSPE